MTGAACTCRTCARTPGRDTANRQPWAFPVLHVQLAACSLTNWDASPYDATATRFAAFIVDKNFPVDYPQYVDENFVIHDYIFEGAWSWTFIDRSDCGAADQPCEGTTWIPHRPRATPLPQPGQQLEQDVCDKPPELPWGLPCPGCIDLPGQPAPAVPIPRATLIQLSAQGALPSAAPQPVDTGVCTVGCPADGGATDANGTGTTDTGTDGAAGGGDDGTGAVDGAGDGNATTATVTPTSTPIALASLMPSPSPTTGGAVGGDNIAAAASGAAPLGGYMMQQVVAVLAGVAAAAYAVSVRG